MRILLHRRRRSVFNDFSRCPTRRVRGVMDITAKLSPTTYPRKYLTTPYPVSSPEKESRISSQKPLSRRRKCSSSRRPIRFVAVRMISTGGQMKLIRQCSTESIAVSPTHGLSLKLSNVGRETLCFPTSAATVSSVMSDD